MSINRNRKVKSRSSQLQEPAAKVSAPHEFLWALIGLLLTIFSTFFEAFITNPPWQWAEKGVYPHSLGVTYQIGAVLLTGCLGGKNAGALAQVAYLVLGLFWLPIFAKGGGLDYFQEPSFGYILGFIPGAWLCGWLAFRSRPRVESLALSAVAGLAIVHLCGLVYLLGLSYANFTTNGTMSLGNLLAEVMNYSVAPLPGQLVIVCVVAVIAFMLRQILFY